jgi:ubiquinone/menaquinone biosynthesis C-methylase UbiE
VSRRSGGRDRGDERRALLEAGTIDHYLDAPLYDFEYSDRVADIRYYRTLAREVGDAVRILELGAGTGRITLPLLRDGHQVTALDAAPSMLKRLESAATTAGLTDGLMILRADMREIPRPDRSCDLVISPFNALMHLYEWRDLLTCFREAYRVLRPGGCFAFDVQLPDIAWLHWDPDVRHAVTRFTHPVTREKLVYSTNHTYDPATQVCHIRIYYDDAVPGMRRFVPPPTPRRLVHLAHRQIFPEELRMLVATAGFALESLTADFTDAPLQRDSESQVACCRKS